jgi:hypothetical protein
MVLRLAVAVAQTRLTMVLGENEVRKSCSGVCSSVVEFSQKAVGHARGGRTWGGRAADCRGCFR